MKSKILIYGAGDMGSFALNYLKNLNILGFIDDNIQTDEDQDDISFESIINTGESLINSNQISDSDLDGSSELSRLNNIIEPAKSKLKIRDNSLKAIDKKMIKQKEKLIVIQRQIVEVLQS